MIRTGRANTLLLSLARKTMSQTIAIELEIPEDLARFRLPPSLNARLQALLDRQDRGQPLTKTERQEAEELVELAEMLSLLRLRAERASRNGKRRP
jgi:hypothetical protein